MKTMEDDYALRKEEKSSEDEEAQVTQEAQENATQEQEVKVEEVKVKEVKTTSDFVMSEDKDLLHSRISILIHSIVAVIVGYASLTLRSIFQSGWIVAAVAIIVLVVMGFGLQRMVGKRGLKWWVSNGLFIYLFFWLISWTMFFNLGL